MKVNPRAWTLHQPKDPRGGRSGVAGHEVLWPLKGSRDKTHRAVTTHHSFQCRPAAREVDSLHKEGHWGLVSLLKDMPRAEWVANHGWGAELESAWEAPGPPDSFLLGDRCLLSPLTLRTLSWLLEIHSDNRVNLSTSRSSGLPKALQVENLISKSPSQSPCPSASYLPSPLYFSTLSLYSDSGVSLLIIHIHFLHENVSSTKTGLFTLYIKLPQGWSSAWQTVGSLRTLNKCECWKIKMLEDRGPFCE